VPGEIEQHVLIDTGFLFGFLSPKDQHHEESKEIYERIVKFHWLVPWPILYEVMNSRIVKRPDALRSLKALLLSPGVHRINDDPYRRVALDDCFRENGTASLVDRVLIGIIRDPNVKVDAVVTFNRRDFEKAARERHIEMMRPGNSTAIRAARAPRGRRR
jgi:predicted nucleic acid-binding protein